jgi:peptide/nickel transport system ATP-binding protein
VVYATCIMYCTNDPLLRQNRDDMGADRNRDGIRMTAQLLRVSGLEVWFNSPEGNVCALSDFSCTLHGGETLAVIGESGCGKSVAAHAIMRILPRSATIKGETEICGRNIESLSDNEMNQVRGVDIGILFQSPDRSLNPLYRIERQILEPLKSHNRQITKNTAYDLLQQAGFDDPGEVREKYPCQCSGGMNQRVLLAEVAGLSPRIFIADEPTKGLDRDRVSDVSALLCKMRSHDRGVLIITHDIMLARNLSDLAMIMYAGEVVECGASHEVLVSPGHPYTKALLMSMPENGFIPIAGMSPALSDIPRGCRFSPRCRHATDLCHEKHPNINTSNGRGVRCHKF